MATEQKSTQMTMLDIESIMQSIESVSESMIETTESMMMTATMSKSVLLEMLSNDLSDKELQILKSAKRQMGDEVTSEFSKVIEIAKSALLANIITLSFDNLMSLLTNIDNYGRHLDYFGEIVASEFTSSELDEFFALVKAKSECNNGKNNDFSEAQESRLNELANKAKGIIIGKIESLETSKIANNILCVL